jgi:transcription initiation factor TFIIIB Brf1 subunit/transcription initiation factor TFIIB
MKVVFWVILSDCKHTWIYDSENQENTCCNCGYVEGSGIDTKLQKDSTFKLLDVNLVDINGLEYIPIQVPTEGFIVPKPTNIDFSNGGFLSTTIDSRNVDSQGKSIDRSYTNKLKYNHNYILSSMGMQQTKKNSLWKIKTYSSKLGLPIHVQERAADVFNRMYDSKANIHNSNNMVCACVYFACKEHNINKKLGDIADIAKAAGATKPLKKSIFLCYQDLIFLHTGETRFKIPRYPTYEQDIIYVGNKIGLPQPTIRYAINMLMDIKSKDRLFFSGKSSKLTATILLYISALIHNDFLRDDVSIEVEEFSSPALGTGISQYILKKRAEDYLNHPYFAEYRKRKEEKEIII